MDIIEYVLSQIDQNKVMPKKMTANKSNISYYNIYYCTECKYVWQKAIHSGGHDDYFEDFPTYKLDRKVCRKCSQ